LFSRAVQAKQAGVPAVTASISVPLELLLTILAWGLTALVGVGLSGAASAWLAWLPAGWLAACAAAVVAVVGAAVALARWQPSAKISKKLGGLQASLRQLKESKPRLQWLLVTTVFFTVLCFFNGAAFLAVLKSGYDAPPSWLAVCGVNAAGWLVGFFAFFAPAGLGVREGGMAAMLAPLMPLDAAVLGVLLWRLVSIVAELVCLGGAFLPAAVSALRRRAARILAAT
jgi:hypothetical protein